MKNLLNTPSMSTKLQPIGKFIFAAYMFFMFSCGDDNGDPQIFPPPSESFNFQIDEEYQGGDEVGDISVVDPQGLSLTYSLVESTSSALFEVATNTGLLSIKTSAEIDVDSDTVLVFQAMVSNGVSENDGILSITVSVAAMEEFSYGKYGAISPVSSNLVGNGWEEFNFSLDDCQCLNGSPFKAAVNDNSDGGNLIITFQGGGACWQGIGGSCESNFTTVLPGYISIADFSLALADSLNEEWNHVMIPYCDKSVYMGENSVDYDNDGDINHFWGFRNSSAGINLAVSKFPNANRILLTGCSAGGYGTIFNLGLVRYHYPDAEIYIINESGAGLFNPEDTETWGNIRSNWNLEDKVPTDCEPCEGQLTAWYDYMMESDEKIKIAQYSSYEDAVIQFFLDMNGTDLNSHLMATTNALNTKYSDRYKRFFINGDSHCFSSLENRNYTVNGQSYWEWVQAFLTDDPSWVDQLE